MCSTALAQPAPPAGGQPGSAGQPSQVDQARTHYERGMQLFNEDNFEAALNEFERAYELAPSFRILFNMARIQRQQNNYAAALQNFQSFLAEGGTAVSDERRREIERDIEVLRSRVASVDVRVNVEGAELFVDDVPVCAGIQGQRGCIGKSPLSGPLLINPGRRKISAMKAGYGTASTLVRVVGSDRTNVRLELRPTTAGGAATNAVEAEGGSSGTLAIATWVGTGAFAIAAGVTGVLALKAQNDLRERRDQYVGTSVALDDDSKKVKNFALATDILGGVAIVGAVAATIFTIQAVSSGDEPARADRGARLRFDVGPAGAALSGRF
jgi:hypothetical protein